MESSFFSCNFTKGTYPMTHKQSIPNFTLYGKAKDCPQVLKKWQKKYTSASCGHFPTFWKITDFCQAPWPEMEHLSMGDDHPQSRTKRENHWLILIMWCSGSHTTCIARHRSFVKLKFTRNACSFWGTLTEQVTCNPRFYCVCVCIYIKKNGPDKTHHGPE